MPAPTKTGYWPETNATRLASVTAPSWLALAQAAHPIVTSAGTTPTLAQRAEFEQQMVATTARQAAAIEAFIEEHAPVAFPASDDASGWARLYAAAADLQGRLPRHTVQLTQVLSRSVNGLMHVHSECERLATSVASAKSRRVTTKILRGAVEHFAWNRFCLDCLTCAPTTLAETVAVGAVTHQIALTHSLSTADQLFHGQRRAETTLATTWLPEAAELLQEHHPRIAGLCRAAADAATVLYERKAAAARALHGWPDTTVSVELDVPLVTARQMLNEPATVRLTGPGWTDSGATLFTSRGFAFALGSNTLVLETNAATMLVLQKRSRRGRKVAVVHAGPVLAAARAIADPTDPAAVAAMWQTAATALG